MVTQERAREFQKKMKLDGFYETSAKNGQNVEGAFVEAARKLYYMNTNEEDDPAKLTPMFEKAMHGSVMLERRCQSLG